MGGVPGPIPWNAIDQYAKRFDFKDDAFEDLKEIINEMDEVFLKFMLEKHKEEN